MNIFNMHPVGKYNENIQKKITDTLIIVGTGPESTTINLRVERNYNSLGVKVNEIVP